MKKVDCDIFRNHFIFSVSFGKQTGIQGRCDFGALVNYYEVLFQNETRIQEHDGYNQSMLIYLHH